MTASSILVFGILLALPIVALPAILFGAPVDGRLARAAVVGGVFFVALCVAGVAAMLYDRPLLAFGRAVQSIRNRVRRRSEPARGLPERFLKERDAVSEVLGQNWLEAILFAAGRWVLDYLTL